MPQVFFLFLQITLKSPSYREKRLQGTVVDAPRRRVVGDDMAMGVMLLVTNMVSPNYQGWLW